MTNLISFDPGGRTGWVRYIDSKPVKLGEVVFDDVFNWLDGVRLSGFDEKPEVFVYEDYIIRPAKVAGHGYAHQWNKGEALKVIGGILTIAAQLGIPAIAQQPAIKPIAAKRCDLPYDPKKSGRGTHQMDAMLHGHWWLLNNAS